MNKELKKYPVYNPFAILGGNSVKCKVVKVYDGDTIWVVSSELPATPDDQKEVRIKLRLKGINTEELKTKSARAIEAKNYLTSLVYDKVVYCTFYGHDNFARALAVVHLNDLNVNQHMIDMGLADPYMVDK